jgi:hypothetical protein
MVTLHRWNYPSHQARRQRCGHRRMQGRAGRGAERTSCAYERSPRQPRVVQCVASGRINPSHCRGLSPAGMSARSMTGLRAPVTAAHRFTRRHAVTLLNDNTGHQAAAARDAGDTAVGGTSLAPSIALDSVGLRGPVAGSARFAGGAVGGRAARATRPVHSRTVATGYESEHGDEWNEPHTLASVALRRLRVATVSRSATRIRPRPPPNCPRCLTAQVPAILRELRDGASARVGAPRWPA